MMAKIKGEELQGTFDQLIENGVLMREHAAGAKGEKKLKLLDKAQEFINMAGALTAKVAIDLVGEGAIAAAQVNDAMAETSKTLARITKTADALAFGASILLFVGALLTGSLPTIIPAAAKLNKDKEKFDAKYPQPPN
jgi:hypothetical protein